MFNSGRVNVLYTQNYGLLSSVNVKFEFFTVLAFIVKWNCFISLLDMEISSLLYQVHRIFYKICWETIKIRHFTFCDISPQNIPASQYIDLIFYLNDLLTQFVLAVSTQNYQFAGQLYHCHLKLASEPRVSFCQSRGVTVMITLCGMLYITAFI